ncbi:MAG TPA: endonuclease [Flavobacteriales bacterium]|nr:endonuclease [Flavobacteriales bacterium]
MRIPSTVLLATPLLTFAQPPAGYYDPAAGLSGQALRVALRDIIDGHTVLANSDLWAAYEATDRKPNNTVWDIYSDVPDGTPPYEFAFGTDQCGTYDEEGDCFNREHSFPQSWFNGAPGMDTDLFHMYPTDAWVNQQRGNWPFGTVSNPTFTSENGGKRGPCTWPGCSGTVFEPIDAYKGDLARGYFYMLTRYMDQASSWPAPVLDQGEFLPWVEDLLLTWHLQDPVSPKEVARNNTIFTSLQGNRNPFIDNPQWVQYIWGPTAGISDNTDGRDRIWQDGELVRIRTAEAAQADVSIYDMRGGLFLATSFTGGQGAVLLDAPAGIYLVVLDTGNGRLVQRVVR